LFALAVLTVSGASFAQSSVSIVGNADVGLVSVTGKKAAFTHGGGNSTPAVFINVIEDLGGGMKAEASYEINPNLTAATIANSQAYVGLSGGFGTVRLGMPNTGLVGTQAGRTPFGTALGSNYSAGVGGIGNDLFANTRMAGAVQYRSPAMGGFSVIIDHAPQFAAVAAVAATAATATKVETLGSNAVAAKEANTIVTLTGTVAGITLNYSNSQNHLGTADGRTDLSASAKLGGVTLYVGHGKSDAAGAKAVNNIAAMYPMGAISLRANMAKQGDDSSTTFGVQYDLSKRTSVYAKFDATEKASKDINTTAFGVRHSF
jgi:predicted porin